MPSAFLKPFKDHPLFVVGFCSQFYWHWTKSRKTTHLVSKIFSPRLDGTLIRTGDSCLARVSRWPWGGGGQKMYEKVNLLNKRISQQDSASLISSMISDKIVVAISSSISFWLSWWSHLCNQDFNSSTFLLESSKMSWSWNYCRCWLLVSEEPASPVLSTCWIFSLMPFDYPSFVSSEPSI